MLICALAYRRVACWVLCFLLSINCLGLDDIFKRHQLKYHMYAVDTQLYVEFPRDQQVPATAATNLISLCTADVKTYMASHNLLLNEQKTEVVVIAAPNCSRVHSKVTVAVSIDVCGVSVMPKPSIRDIGVVIDDRAGINDGQTMDNSWTTMDTDGSSGAALASRFIARTLGIAGSCI